MNTLSSLLNPGVLFFILGFLAAMVRSNLSIPDSVVKFISLYLMLSIGYKGGVSLYHSSLYGDGLIILGIIIVMSALVPIYTFLLFRKKLGPSNAAAIGATYGSNSTLTYITGAGFLTAMGIPFEGYMTVALVVMETPAIIFAIIMARLAVHSDQGQSKSTAKIICTAFTDGTMLLLVGSMAIGYIETSMGSEKSPLAAFISGDLFTGMLVFFLLYMGTVVGKKIRDLKSFPILLVVFALVAPLVNAAIALVLCILFKFNAGDAFLLTVLCASASYIVAPAIIKEALPDADPSKFLTMSLGITFPLNIIVGLPLYWWIIEKYLAV